MATVTVACSGTEEPTVPTKEALTASPTQTPTAAPIPATDYDSTENMFRLFSGRDHDPFDTHEAIALAIFHKDKSMVPVMIEVLRFFFGDDDIIEELDGGISAITGQELRSNYRAWDEWMEWLGNNADGYDPPDGYVQWKSELMSLIDPRFADFLEPAAQGSRINVFEIVWGEAFGPTESRIFRAPRSFQRASRTICCRVTGSLACPSTKSTGRTRSAL